ncbi:centrobin isoform X1 [Denticeps clupeoides]|uniref:centrobin isoform X1 n=1 Tax=Denticeps clupeoides TaxID=299321 RepID=UPI0010A31783|nr:centrobin isoform X1 [Denticeps clupeoides]
MSDCQTEDLLSDIEPLPISPPPPSRSKPLPLRGATSPPALARSWPSSPLSALSSSREVTARLYSSLQQSRDGCSVAQSAKPRQVSFKLSSPELWHFNWATPPLTSNRLEGEELDCCPVAESVLGAEHLSEDLRNSINRSNNLQNGRRHIEDMENVRSHLQSMLRSHRTEEGMAEAPPPISQLLDDDSFISDTTSNLLSAPVLSTAGLDELFPRYSRLRRGDAAESPGEMQLLRTAVERERARRKHCEQQLLSLQTKTLSLQQQVALAVAADKKKDIMIEQLDKTLAKVVEGWRRHEQDKSDGIRRLQQEKENVEKTQNRQQEMLTQLEESLSQAADALDREQTHKQELDKTNKQLEQQLVQLRERLQKLSEEAEHLRVGGAEARSEVERLRTHNLNLQTELQQEREESSRREGELTTQHTHALERERMSLSQQQQRCEDLQVRLREEQQQKEEMRRERDAARVDRTLDQARFEAQRSQLEAELKITLEEQVTEKLGVLQEEHSRNTAKLREHHRKQLIELSSQHELEMSAQQSEFSSQLQERDERLHTLTQQSESRVSALKEELVSMATSKRKLETQKAELISRLQGMMRSHWTEALKLLTGQDQQVDGSLSPPPVWSAFRSQSSPPENTAERTNPAGTESPAPQAVFLHLSRERDGEPEQRNGESEVSVLNHSQIFTPLEAVLDETSLTALGSSDLEVWGRSPDAEREVKETSHSQESVPKQKLDSAAEQSPWQPEVPSPSPNHDLAPKQSQSLSQFHYQNASQSHSSAHKQNQNQNQPWIQSQSEGLSQNQNQQNHDSSQKHVPKQRTFPNQFPGQSRHLDPGQFRGPNPTQHVSHSRIHQSVSSSSPERSANQGHLRSQVIRDTPGHGEWDKTKAPPPTQGSNQTLNPERQSELQYYITKLLDRSPGEPLDVQAAAPASSSTGHAEDVSAARHGMEVPGTSTDPLAHAQPNTHTLQQLQQLYINLLRAENEKSAASAQSSLDQKVSGQEKTEVNTTQRRPPSQAASSRGRKAGPPGHRPGPGKTGAWR